MKNALDSRFETLFLLAVPVWGKSEQEQVVEALEDFGLNGKVFYATHYPVIERYRAAFQSKRVESEGASLLGDLDEGTFLVYTTALLQNEAWFEGFGDVAEEEAREAVRAVVLDGSDYEDVVDVLDAAELTDQARWQIMALLEQPKRKLAPVIDAVRENVGAFEFACMQVSSELDVMLQRFDEQAGKRNPSNYLHLARTYNPQAKIVPTLAAPLVVMVLEGACFYGLLVDRLIDDKSLGYSPAEIVLGAKALGDSSKFEILLSLKDGWRYGQEIARMVGLTPATVSHHMGTLLNAGFVTLEKRDGKVYYRLSEDGVSRFLDGIKASLL